MPNDLHLPADIIEKILCKLPVKAVLRCKLLQKSYYSLINSKTFIHTYNREAHLNPTSSPLIFMRFTDQNGEEKFSLHNDDSRLKESMPLRFPFQDRYNYDVVSCCKSLVCIFRNRGNKLILWNPYIQQSLILPQPNSSIDRYSLFGLGFDDESNDYKVLMITKKYQAELYSLEHNSWKILADTAPRYRWAYTVQPFSVKGSLYWICANPNSKKSAVGVFDLKHQIFREISLPKGWDISGTHGLCLKIYGESSIAVVLNYPSPQIQVMDVGGKDKKWKLLTRAHKFWKVKVLGFRKNGEVIFDSEGRRRIALFNLDSFNKQIIKHSYIRFSFAYNYVESLALLDKTRDSSATNCPRDSKRRKLSRCYIST